MKKFAFAVLAIALLVGSVMAVDPINATVETQAISTSTAVTVMGTMTNSESVVLTMSNQDIRNNPPLNQWTYIGDDGFPDETETNNVWTPERQAVFSYTESVLADNGYTEFNGVQSMDTANKVANQKNFNSVEQYDFVAFTDAMGRITTSESQLLDLASQGSDALSRMLCPFATGDAGYIPAYCNVYEMGSSFTGGQVSAVTRANTNFIAKAADVPTQIDYSVGLAGTGSAAAWVNAHVMEGRTMGYYETATNDANGEDYTPAFWNYDTGAVSPRNGFAQGVDLVYKEKTTASGVIESFSKSISIQDAIRRL
ncbi:MAG TPA: hypothetical protein PK069_07680 [Methanolinea sp.]|nr:hypothetical protein [Methanolinea sp.]HQK55445.1 hypothetical protein [Methanolinea sp.]